MADRFTRGFVAALVAGVPTFIFNWASFSFHIATLRWSDFMGLFLFGHKPVTGGEAGFAVFAVYVFLSLLGGLAALTIPAVTSQNYFLKAWAYGVGIWFISFAIGILFQVPELSDIPVRTAASNFVGASVWGLTMGYNLNWLDYRVK